MEQHPVPKVASPTQSTLSLRHLESIFPPARDSCGVGVLSLSFLLAPDLPAAFQPNISALLFVLLFVSSSLPGSRSLSLGFSTYTPPLASIFLRLCFSLWASF